MIKDIIELSKKNLNKITDLKFGDLVGKTQKVMYEFFIPLLEKSAEQEAELIRALVESYELDLSSLNCEFCSHGYTYNDDMNVGCGLKINSSPLTCRKFEYYLEEMEQNSVFENHLIRKLKLLESITGKKWEKIKEEWK